MTPEPGIYTGVPFTEYHSWEAANNSLLKIIADKSPLHARAYMDFPPEPTPAFVFGRAQHCLVLEPKKFEAEYVVAPKCDRRTKDGKALWEAFEKNANGKEIVTYQDYATMCEITKAIKGQVISRCIEGGEAEVCVVWVDKRTGMLCKARADYAHRGQAIIIDMKTTTDASPVAFAKAVANYRYLQQAAFYSDGWKEATEILPAFVFLPVEKEYPYAAAAYQVTDEDIEAGRNMYRKALKIYAECVKTNTWPGYGGSVEMLDMPDWWRKQHGVHQFNL